MTTDPPSAAARIRTYLRLTPTAHTLGGEIAYSEEFRSDDWPRSAYAPTREDVEALLADLARAQAEVYQYRTALQGVARRDAAVSGRADTLRWAADQVAALDPVEAALAGQHAWADAAALLRRLADEEAQP